MKDQDSAVAEDDEDEFVTPFKKSTSGEKYLDMILRYPFVDSLLYSIYI